MISRRIIIASGIVLFIACCQAAATNTAHVECGISREGRVRLSSGRILAYHEFGDPTGPLVFYFHGTPGSRVEAGLIECEAAAAGIHLVAIDRPGIGRSSYYSGRRITDWPRDVEELATALGHGDGAFGVIGMSGGAPYAMACARMIPHRLTHVAIVSGHAELGAPGVAAGSEDKIIALVTRRPKLSRIGLNFVSRRLDRRPDKVIEKVSKNWAAVDRNLILCNPEYYRRLVQNLNEAVYCGTHGLVKDIQLLACDWGFELNCIQGVSVSIWQGGCDSIAPPSTGRYFHRQIAGSEFHFDPRAGHVTMLKWHAPEIFARFSNP